MKKWELLSSETILQTKWMKVEKRTYRLPDGRIQEDYYHLERSDYVLIVAVDDQKRILVVRQYRRGVDEFVYELPAGWIERNESPFDAAKRELREETGFLGEGKEVYELYAQPEFSSMKGFVVILHVETIDDNKAESNEDMTVEWMTISEIEKKIVNEEIKDMGFVAAINIYKNC